MTDTQAPDVVVTEVDRAAGERGPIAWMYVYNVRYEYKLECTKRQPPVVTLSLTRWTEKQRTHWIETPLFATLSTQSTMQARIEELEAALRFYADAGKWDDFAADQQASVFDRNFGSELGSDRGALARATISNIGSSNDG